MTLHPSCDRWSPVEARIIREARYCVRHGIAADWQVQIVRDLQAQAARRRAGAAELRAIVERWLRERSHE